jgi:hypothetical protein
MIARASAGAALGLLVAMGAGHPAFADGPLVACRPDVPTVEPGGTTVLRVWAAGATENRSTYDWSAPVGRITGRGRQVRWELAGLRPGTYAAAVKVRDASGEVTECVLRVTVRPDAGPRGDSPAPARETGAALLQPADRETEGYGLYSYLLLGAPPSPEARERYQKAVEAFWTLLPEIVALEKYVPRAQLNVAYVPVTAAPGARPSAQWILEHYDHPRARSLLRHLPGPHRDGPYLVSALAPLGGGPPAGGRYLFQDLSSVPPHLAAAWVKEFLNQAAQERFWDERTGARLALRLRLVVGILGEGLPEVRRALDGWISWGR